MRRSRCLVRGIPQTQASPHGQGEARQLYAFCMLSAIRVALCVEVPGARLGSWMSVEEEEANLAAFGGIYFLTNPA